MLQAPDFSIKPRDAALERIEHADGCAHGERREAQPPGAHRSATLRKNRIDSHRPNEGAFSRHVWPADDEYPQVISKAQVVPHGAAVRQQGMGKAFGFKTGR